jgi:hypothetical protein
MRVPSTFLAPTIEKAVQMILKSAIYYTQYNNQPKNTPCDVAIYFSVFRDKQQASHPIPFAPSSIHHGSISGIDNEH